jgi:hypothetical protein
MDMTEAGFTSLPLGPARAAPWILSEVDSAAARDPSIREARRLLEQRFVALDEADIATLTSVMWMWLRGYITSAPFSWPPYAGLVGLPPGLHAIRVGLSHGDRLLSAVEQSLGTTLKADALQRIARETRDVAHADPRMGDQLNLIEDELRGGGEAEVTAHGVAVGIAIGVGATAAGIAIGWAPAEFYHHHVEHHP